MGKNGGIADRDASKIMISFVRVSCGRSYISNSGGMECRFSTRRVDEEKELEVSDGRSRTLADSKSGCLIATIRSRTALLLPTRRVVVVATIKEYVGGGRIST